MKVSSRNHVGPPWLPLTVALVLAAAGCALDKPTTPKHPVAAGAAHPAVAPSVPQVNATASLLPDVAAGGLHTLVNATTLPVTAATLTGKVKLLAGAGGGIISNNGGAIISDNGGAIVANNAGNIVSNNAGGVVANNSGNLTAQAGNRYHVAAEATAVTEALLADAVVSIQDAKGAPVLDAVGKPLTATTDRQGNYTFTTALPPRNLVMRVKLWQGGELSALLPYSERAGREQSISTATTLGATYVLTKFVQGDQPTFDKLPAAEADKLNADLDRARAGLPGPPQYKSDELLGLAETLQGKVPAVAQTLAEIKLLLLGQAHLGDGRAADHVAIYSPRAVTVDAAGNLLFAEPYFGRIRQVAVDGTLSTLADVIRGKVKHNFPGITDMVIAPDGSYYIATVGQVVKLTTSGEVVTVAGAGASVPGASPQPVAVPTISPFRLALAADGTLYIGESGQSGRPPRVVALHPDGTLTPVSIADTWSAADSVAGLVAEPDGSLEVLFFEAATRQGTIYHYQPGKAVTIMADKWVLGHPNGGLARGAGGVLYVSESEARRVSAIAPDGTHKVVAGVGGPPNTSPVRLPTGLATGPDGTLYIADGERNLVFALRPDGTFVARAGAESAVGTDLRNISLDMPLGAAYDATGRLFVAEHGGHRIAMFANGALATSAGGSGGGFSGDGGAANAAQLSFPSGLAFQGKDYIFADGGNGRLRKVSADGTITTLVGAPLAPGATWQTLAADGRVKANEFQTHPDAVAIAPDGRVYWSSVATRQIYRLAADGMVELVAGKFVAPTTASDFTRFLKVGPAQEATGASKDAILSAPLGLAFDAKGDLYVADTGSLLVRKITGLDGTAPVISRFAGTSSLAAIAPGAGGAGADNALVLPAALVFDTHGNLLVSELGTASIPLLTTVTDATAKASEPLAALTYARIRRITPDGKMSTVAGPGGPLFASPLADDGLVMPQGLAIAPDGSLAIMDGGANLVHLLPAGSF